MRRITFPSGVISALLEKSWGGKTFTQMTREDKEEGERTWRCVSPWYLLSSGTWKRFSWLFFMPFYKDCSGLRVGEVKDRTQEHHEHVRDPQQLLHKGNLQRTQMLTQNNPSDLPQPRSEMLLDHSCQSVTVPHNIRVCAGVRRLKQPDSFPAHRVCKGGGEKERERTTEWLWPCPRS